MIFQYKALRNNKVVIKRLEAQSEAAVIQYLKNNDYLPIEIKRVDSQSVSFFSQIFNRVTFTDIVDFTRQLAIMLNAGLTLIDSFIILKQQIKKTSLLKVIEDIDKELRAGNSLSKSLQKYPQYFPTLYIALIKSGEASGKLSDIMLKLADNLEKQREFRGKIKGALIYPIIVIVGMILVMFVMITFVVPQLLNIYKDFNIELPITTQLLIAVSSFSTRFWPFMIAGVLGGFVLLRNYTRTKSGKLIYDKTLLKVPAIGPVIRISDLVDSTRTLSILIGAGVSILDGLNIIIETNSNMVYKQAFQNIYTNIEKGVSMGVAMSQEGVFPPILVQMVIVGEQTGKLDETLLRISKYFEMESEMAVKTLTTLIEPLILVELGVGVGFLVMAVITPIYNLTNSFT
jgi:type IV pilus assembly protein PilC